MLARPLLFTVLTLACAGTPTPRPVPPGANAPADGRDLLPEARLLLRIAACQGDAPVPPAWQATVDRHCALLAPLVDGYKRDWLAVAGPFLAQLRPKDLPPAVVYPFGGGDLLSALATFPDATEITTISLEPAGDLRALAARTPTELGPALEMLRDHLERFFRKAHSKTESLEKEAKSALPGELSFSVVALGVLGFEPVGLRYVALLPDGRLRYLPDAELTADTARLHVELEFRKVGEATAPRVLRHFAVNLHDDFLGKDPSLLRHLEAKGPVAAMTKAASHLLWSQGFSRIRDYLFAAAPWMISDDTGPAPRHAAEKGFSQDTYGRYEGPEKFGSWNEKDGADLAALFARDGGGELPFRYGYPDRASHGHIVVTKRK